MSHYNIGAKVQVDGRAGEIRGIQDLEPPVSYLVKYDDDGSNAWLKDESVKPAGAKPAAAAIKKPAKKK